MDSVTHVLLGGAVGLGLMGKRAGMASFFVGALAATMPDFDVFLHTGDVVRDHVLHRHFMHSVVLVPVLAALAMLPFLRMPRVRACWAAMYGTAVLACATHGALDALTSYGTMVFWPFTWRRYALDVVAVVDLTYTGILAIGIVWAWRRKSMRAARWALALSTLYLGVAWVQHGRAVQVQREILAARGQLGAQNPRVLPQIGATLNYRSLYVFEGRIYADAIRVAPFSTGRVKEGSSVVRAGTSDANGGTEALWSFSYFADGFVARVPGHEETIGDMRYTGSPEGFAAVWGITFDRSGKARWVNFARTKMVTRYWRDLVRPSGYAPPAMIGQRSDG